MKTPQRKILQDFRQQKLRTVIVVASITVGVFCITGVGTVSSVLTKAVSHDFHASRGADIVIVTSAVNSSTVQRIAQVPNVSAVEGRTLFQSRVKGKSRWFPLTLIGVESFNNMRVDRVTRTAGKFPAPGQIMIESTSQQLLNVQPGQRLSIRARNRVEGLTVSGAGRSPSASATPAFTTNIAVAFMRAADVRALSGTRGVNYFFVTMQGFSSRQATVSGIVSALGKSGAIIRSFDVRDPSHAVGASDIANKLSQFMTIFGVVALVLSGMLVVNTLSTVISEQTPVIGTMKAVGASSGQIIRTYLTLGFLYGLAGTILGLILGIVGAYEIVQQFASRNAIQIGGLDVSLGALIPGILVGIGVSLVAALIPVIRGSRITVQQAISSYGIGTGYKPSAFDAVVDRLGFLSRPARMSVRNTFRRPGRVALTLAPLALAGSILLGVGSAAQSLNSTVGLVTHVYHADLLVTLGNPKKRNSILSPIQSVSGVTHAEAWYRVPVAIAGQTDVQLAGAPSNTTSYRYSLTSGRWLSSTDTNIIVLSNTFARSHSLSVGQRLEVLPPDQTVRNWLIVGMVNDQSDSGNVAFAPLSQVQNLTGEVGKTNYLFVTSSDKSAAAISSLTDRLTSTLFPLGAQPDFKTVTDLKGDIQSQFNILVVLLYIMVVLVALVGALGLFAVLAMNVVERRKEIGVMRSIGASSRDVIQVFTVEGLAIGLAASVLAVVLGVPASIALTLVISKIFIPLTFSFAVAYIAVLFVFTLIVAALASIGPATSAAKLKIADVLRYG
jgi:putative ABC transport system permease protein